MNRCVCCGAGDVYTTMTGAVACDKCERSVTVWSNETAQEKWNRLNPAGVRHLELTQEEARSLHWACAHAIATRREILDSLSDENSFRTVLREDIEDFEGLLTKLKGVFDNGE